MQNQNITAITCPFCRTQSEMGIQVCPGPNCGASIIYGATDKELEGAQRQTTSITFILSMLALMIGPSLINDQFNFDFPIMFGSGFYGVIAGFCLSFWLGLRSRASLNVAMSGQVRFFRWMPKV